MPSTQPVEIGMIGEQTDQRQYIDKTELLSVPLATTREDSVENGTTISGPNATSSVELRKFRLKNQARQNNLTTSSNSNSNSTSSANQIERSLGPEYRLIELKLDR